FDHHTCHAASAYYSSPFVGEEALVLTQDGSGDGACATVSIARDGRLERLATTPSGHSLGDIYARITHLMGMIPLEHEYKLMGLAPYADPGRAEAVCRILEGLLEVDGLLFKRTTLKPTQFVGGRLLKELQFHRFDCIAAGLQLFFEKRITEWVRNAVAQTGIGRLCLGGGSFMNVKGNKLIAELPEVEQVFVCPSCGDESLSLGAAQLAHLEADHNMDLPEPLGPIYLGFPIEEQEVDGLVAKLDHVEVETPDNMPARVAQLLAEGEIVARCSGRTEFGARALGNRSILADPSKPLAVRVLNQMIKMRDFWMPFAPILRASRQGGYLVNPNGRKSPYMMSAFDTCPEKYNDIACAVQPADKTARPQLIEEGQNPEVEALLTEFEAITGRPILLNTSYNIHGEPMVGTAAQGVDVFLRSGLQWLWLGNRLLHKTGASSHEADQD
ncbi:MAG: carbamoyltransferase C-terminal domain-containing protein, partial [Planctomycetota bacterium]